MESVSQGAALTIVASISRRWGAKRDVITMIGRYPDGVVAPYRDVADMLEVGERYAWRVLRELVRDRVLDELEAPAGRRGVTYALNPFLGEWRGVPWKTSVELVVFRAFYERPEPDEGAPRRSAALRDRGTRPVVPRSHSAAQRGADRLVPRSHGAAQRGGRAAISHRGTTPNPALVVLPGGSRDASVDDGSASKQQQESSYPAVVGEVARAIVRTAKSNGHRRAFLTGGPPLAELAELLERYRPHELVDLLADAPPELGVPMLVRWVGEQLADPTPNLEPAGPSPWDEPVPALRPFVPDELDPDAIDPLELRNRARALRESLPVTPERDNEPARVGGPT